MVQQKQGLSQSPIMKENPQSSPSKCTNEHDKIKSYDLTKTDGVTPLVYYLPKSKFDYELTFENPEQIKTLYVTSTRNNQTKYLEATYDPEKMRFVTDGYFDESITIMFLA